METINLTISGMHCDGCAERLQKVLSGKNGVRDSNVSFSEKNAYMQYDSETVNPDQLKSAVEKAGFEVVNA